MVNCNFAFRKPYVKFQELWRLVRITLDGPPETYQCMYLVDWANQTVRNFEGPIENARLLFEATQKRWGTSIICDAFTSQFHKLLGGDGSAEKVNKIACFGLGDINFKPPDWWREENNSKPENERVLETNVVEGALVHHAIALTMADVARSYATTGDRGVRLLTQDPGYSDETKDMLQDIEFEVIGEYGAGGFAELDDESDIFCVRCCTSQADLRRPRAAGCYYLR